MVGCSGEVDDGVGRMLEVEMCGAVETGGLRGGSIQA